MSWKHPNPIDIVLDFDGTCVDHQFPAVGPDVPGCVDVLRKLTSAGHRLILFTMRSNRTEHRPTETKGIQDVVGNFLDDAVQWFEDRDIPLHGIQTNPTQKNWTDSPKAWGQLHIDDSALGAPLTMTAKATNPHVDWREVEFFLLRNHLIKPTKTR